jgi:hypothetical protein
MVPVFENAPIALIGSVVHRNIDFASRLDDMMQLQSCDVSRLCGKKRQV